MTKVIVWYYFSVYLWGIKKKNMEKRDYNNSPFYKIINDFRNWQRDWDLYRDSGHHIEKPISVDDLIKELEKKYIVLFNDNPTINENEYHVRKHGLRYIVYSIYDEGWGKVFDDDSIFEEESKAIEHCRILNESTK